MTGNEEDLREGKKKKTRANISIRQHKFMDEQFYLVSGETVYALVTLLHTHIYLYVSEYKNITGRASAYITKNT